MKRHQKFQGRAYDLKSRGGHKEVSAVLFWHKQSCVVLTVHIQAGGSTAQYAIAMSKNQNKALAKLIAFLLLKTIPVATNGELFIDEVNVPFRILGKGLINHSYLRLVGYLENAPESFPCLTDFD